MAKSHGRSIDNPGSKEAGADPDGPKTGTQESTGYTADPMSQSEGGPASSAVEGEPAFGRGAEIEAQSRDTGARADTAEQRDPSHNTPEKRTFGAYDADKSFSLEESDEASLNVAKNPGGRVTLDAMKADMKSVAFINGNTAAEYANGGADVRQDVAVHLAALTICIITVSNGFSFVGKSAPADPLNFDADYGRKLAYDDAVRQMWPVYGFAKRNELAAR